jgi:hypothetical protein
LWTPGARGEDLAEYRMNYTALATFGWRRDGARSFSSAR